MLLRFYDVNEGAVLVDGVDVRDWDLQSLRKAMGLVMQEPTLFNYSILENILYGDPAALNSQVREVAGVANALEFIEGSGVDEEEIDESPEALYQEMKRNEKDMEELMGQEVYKKAEKVLDKLRKEEAKKGAFVAIVGDIDSREQEK